MTGHTNNVSCVIFHPKRELIVSNSEDRSIRVSTKGVTNVIYFEFGTLSVKFNFFQEFFVMSTKIAVEDEIDGVFFAMGD